MADDSDPANAFRRALEHAGGSGPRGRQFRLWYLSIPFAMAGAAAWLWAARVDPPAPPPEWTQPQPSASASPAATPNGAAARPTATELRVVAVRGRSAFELSPGQTVKTGDQLRFVLRADGPRYVAIFRTLAGNMVRVFPPDPGDARQVKPAVVLPSACVVDGLPGSEEIFAAVAKHPFPADGTQPPDGETVRVTIGKDVGPMPAPPFAPAPLPAAH